MTTPIDLEKLADEIIDCDQVTILKALQSVRDENLRAQIPSEKEELVFMMSEVARSGGHPGHERMQLAAMQNAFKYIRDNLKPAEPLKESQDSFNTADLIKGGIKWPSEEAFLDYMHSKWMQPEFPYTHTQMYKFAYEWLRAFVEEGK
jgi:hypothetical protein